MAEHSDNFPQADENPLSSGGNWVAAGTNPRPQVVGNRVRVAALGDFATSIYNTAVANDQFAQITVPTWNNSGAAVIIAGLLLRAADAPTVTYYEIDIIEDPGLTARYEIYRVVAGAYTALAGPTNMTVVAGDILCAMIRGATLFLFQNNALVVSVVDGSPIASGKIGLIIDVHAGGTINDVEVDDFIGGDLRKTRFYLPNTGAAEISPAFTLQASWTATTGADRIRMPVARIASAMTSKVQAAPGTAANQKWLFRQYVSDPIRGGGSIFGALFGQIRGLESAANDNIDAISLKLLVVDSAGNLRGTLLPLANYGTIAELNTALRNKIIANGDGLTAVTYQNGDRIVAEIGLTNTVAGTSVSGSLSFGDDSATDLAEDETATAANNPWLEIVGMNLQLGLQPMTKPNLYALKRASFH